MRRWSWHGLAALILAVCLGGSYAAVLVITALQAGPVTGEGAQLLTNLGGILAGALAGWLGGATVAHRRDVSERAASSRRSEEEEEPE